MFEKTSIFEFDRSHPECHCSVIQELSNGELMSVWYAGKKEAHKSVGLKASWKKLNDPSSKWSEPMLIHKTPNRPDGNEVIIEHDGKIHMVFNTIFGSTFPWTKTHLFHCYSKDFGRTWSEPVQISTEKGYTVRTKPLKVMKDGKPLFIIPMGFERITKCSSRMLITEDFKNFRYSNEIWLDKGINIQPAITQLPDGRILAYLRTDTGYLYKTYSNDLGLSWSKPERLEFNNPDSALDFVLTPDNKFVLVWNNNPKKGHVMSPRKSLSVALSEDFGSTWKVIKPIEEDVNAGRFEYPAIIYGSDKNFHLTYTYLRKNIRYVKFDMKWLEEKNDKN